jgi:hypothetical protein
LSVVTGDNWVFVYPISWQCHVVVSIIVEVSKNTARLGGQSSLLSISYDIVPPKRCTNSDPVTAIAGGLTAVLNRTANLRGPTVVVGLIPKDRRGERTAVANRASLDPEAATARDLAAVVGAVQDLLAPVVTPIVEEVSVGIVEKVSVGVVAQASSCLSAAVAAVEVPPGRQQEQQVRCRWLRGVQEQQVRCR